MAAEGAPPPAAVEDADGETADPAATPACVPHLPQARPPHARSGPVGVPPRPCWVHALHTIVDGAAAGTRVHTGATTPLDAPTGRRGRPPPGLRASTGPQSHCERRRTHCNPRRFGRQRPAGPPVCWHSTPCIGWVRHARERGFGARLAGGTEGFRLPRRRRRVADSGGALARQSRLTGPRLGARGGVSQQFGGRWGAGGHPSRTGPHPSNRGSRGGARPGAARHEAPSPPPAAASRRGRPPARAVPPATLPPARDAKKRVGHRIRARARRRRPAARATPAPPPGFRWNPRSGGSDLWRRKGPTSCACCTRPRVRGQAHSPDDLWATTHTVT